MTLIINHWPQAVQVASGNMKRFPLHLACEKSQVSLPVLYLLAWTWPNTLHSPDKEGFLPLHLACKKQRLGRE